MVVNVRVDSVYRCFSDELFVFVVVVSSVTLLRWVRGFWLLLLRWRRLLLPFELRFRWLPRIEWKSRANLKWPSSWPPLDNAASSNTFFVRYMLD